MMQIRNKDVASQGLKSSRAKPIRQEKGFPLTVELPLLVVWGGILVCVPAF